MREKVWTMFNDKAAEMLLALHTAMETGVHEDVATRAHAFKSMALSSGFAALASDLADLELLAKDGANESVAPDTKDRIAQTLRDA